MRDCDTERYVRYQFSEFAVTFRNDGVVIARIVKPDTEGESMKISFDKFEAWLEKLWDEEF